MPVAVWPETLPQIPLIAGYGEAEADNVLRTDMEIGPAKARRRSTAAVRPLNFPMVLTKAELDIFRAFYRDTLTSGVLAFLISDPTDLAAGATSGGGSGWMGGWLGGWMGGWFGSSGATATLLVRFTEAPQWSALGRQLYATQMMLEILP